jgi:isoleucyl-tRNA synthetase
MDLIREELNVLEVKLGADEDRRQFGTTRFKPNFRSLGARGLGKKAQEFKREWANLYAPGFGKLLETLESGRGEWGETEILAEDVEVSFEPKPGFAAAADRVGSVFFDTTLDDELRDLGLLRELVNRIQTARKEMGLEYTDRINLSVLGSERIARVVDRYKETLAAEVLAVEVCTPEHKPSAKVSEVDLDGEAVQLGIVRA